MPENDNNDALPQAGNGEVEPYKLREIFSIVPEFEGDQIFLNTFFECLLRGRAAQLISSRNPNTYPEIKQLLNLHFGDSRDLTSPNPRSSETKTITGLIETMALNTLLTGLEPRLGQIIRASNPRDLLEAHMRDQQDYYTDNSQHNYQPDYYTDNGQYNYQQECYTDNTNNIQDDYNDFQNYQTNEYEGIPNNYQDFLTLPDLNNTPDTNTQSTDPSSTIQSQMLTLNLDDMNPNLNFSEQNFI
ncbi:hypothetical protein NQ317_017661 [Molorchus minor]|uniref:Uncharacterized protein n=1 Tax=Molorchus minor TaxID=1323400 RepID=A0ABQ9JWG0_9CUCU|nr:hypothetical protein NQ317_017661 [Molorchus minor]